MSDRQRLDVARTPKEGVLIVQFRSTVRGIITHWKGRGEACIGLPACKIHGIKPVWKGYAHALKNLGDTKWIPVLVEVTENLDEELELFGDYLGSVWKLRRVRRSANRVEVTGECLNGPVPIMPCELPMLPTLMTFYDVGVLPMDIPRPSSLVPRVEIVEMPAPPKPAPIEPPAVTPPGAFGAAWRAAKAHQGKADE